ncbi:MAG: BCCT family transporter [Clostridia bacterium]
MFSKKSVELRIFIPSVAIALIAILAMLLIPEQAKIVIDEIFQFLTYDLGWIYLIVVPVLFIFSLWIAFSKYGKIKLGEENEKKEYSDWSWTAMLFAAGMSISVVLLGFVEPINLLSSTPSEIESMSNEAYLWSHMCAQFFEGPIAWGVYGAASAAIAYTIYVKKVDVLRFSGACSPVLGKQTNRFWGTVLDVLVMLGMIGGISTSLGMGTPAVTAMISHLTGIPNNTGLTIFVLCIWALLFGTSVFMGLDKGIKRLSDINLYLLFALMVIVFFSMPISDFFYLELNSLGMMMDNLGDLLLGSGIFSDDTFTQDWTIFYWAWWLAFMPMIALFGARVSRGRTIKQMILGELLYGGGGSLLVFGLLGGYSIYLQSSGTLDLVNILSTSGREQAVISILETLPFANIILVMVLILIFVFLATTIDSTAYTLASVCTPTLSGNEQPTRFNRMVWALILLLFSLGLVLIGGLETIQTASILLGFPLIFISIIVIISVLKMFKEHEKIESLKK